VYTPVLKAPVPSAALDQGRPALLPAGGPAPGLAPARACSVLGWSPLALLAAARIARLPLPSAQPGPLNPASLETEEHTKRNGLEHGPCQEAPWHGPCDVRQADRSRPPTPGRRPARRGPSFLPTNPAGCIHLWLQKRWIVLFVLIAPGPDAPDLRKVVRCPSLPLARPVPFASLRARALQRSRSGLALPFPFAP
jgi:hypothetical protein